MSRRIVHDVVAGITVSSTQSIMLRVLMALLPGVLTYAALISPLIFFNIGFAITAALIIEALAVRMTGGNVRVACTDGSIILAATLLAIAVPPTLPFWQLFVGVFIMVVLGKHVYGGIGNNPFNPAMVGYAALIISFPQTMTLWTSLSGLGSLSLIELLNAKSGFHLLTQNVAWDAVTQATPLEHLRSQRIQQINTDSGTIKTLVWHANWIWVNTGFLLGGLYLLFAGLIRWHIPAGVLLAFALLHTTLTTSDLAVHLALFSGAVIIGAFFIATDPVTTASSNRGRLIFGLGVGTLTFVIREYGGYPDGFAFAILLMNLCVPLIDHLELAWRHKRR